MVNKDETLKPYGMHSKTPHAKNNYLRYLCAYGMQRLIERLIQLRPSTIGVYEIFC